MNRILRVPFFAAITTASILLLGWASPASASITLSFDQATNGGTLAYGGAGGALVGDDIIFETIKGEGTPLNDSGVLTITGGLLDFTTGANVSEPAGTSGSWVFANGGSFVLTGDAYDPSSILVASGTLLSGSFSGVILPAVTGGSTSLIFNGFGLDTKNQDLLDYYGIVGTDLFAFLNTVISASVTSFNSTSKAFTANVTNADIVNTQTPEPSSICIYLMLLSTGLVLGVGRRRKNSAKIAA